MIENIKKYGVFVLGVIVILAAYLWVSGYLSNDRAGADAVRTDLRRIAEYQQRIDGRLDTITKGLDSSVKSVERIAGRVEEAASTINSVESRIDSGQVRLVESQRLIERGESVLRDIRQKAKEDPGKVKN